MTRPTRDAIQALLVQGVSQREVARRLECSRRRVAGAKRHANLTSRWPGKPYRASVVAEAVERYRRRERLDDIAATMGLARRTVARWARAAGVEPQFGPRPKWRAEWCEAALERKRAGASWRSIAASYGVTHRTVQMHVERAIVAGRLAL